MSSSATILRLIRSAGTDIISSQVICREMGISRAAVWKQISLLRAAGYSIEAVPSRGYRLLNSPDILSADEILETLTASIIGNRILCHTELTSTNIEAFRLAENGAPEGTVVIAERQTAGKGRRGRQWESPPGVNLYCSVILRPGIMPWEAPQLTFLSAVAVAVAFQESCSIEAEIKWPNDILIGGKKVAGLLNEMSAETDGVNFVILGIGVNLNMTHDQFSAGLRHPATSLFLERGKTIVRARFTATLLNALDVQYASFLAKGFGPVREEWQRRCNAVGHMVQVEENDVTVAFGAFAGIDADGALLVRHAGGEIQRILSGDVRII